MALFGGNIEDLRSLYVTQLQYLLSTEKQIVDALPKMVDAATDTRLKQALQSHLQETKVHQQRLEGALRSLTNSTSDKKCSVTAELIDSGEKTIKLSNDGPVRDVAIIAAAQKVEHFEIASYGSARDWANLLGETEQSRLLQQTLDEEKHADELLTTISQERNVEAAKATAA